MIKAGVAFVFLCSVLGRVDASGNYKIPRPPYDDSAHECLAKCSETGECPSETDTRTSFLLSSDCESCILSQCGGEYRIQFVQSGALSRLYITQDEKDAYTTCIRQARSSCTNCQKETPSQAILLDNCERCSEQCFLSTTTTVAVTSTTTMAETTAETTTEPNKATEDTTYIYPTTQPDETTEATTTEELTTQPDETTATTTQEVTTEDDVTTEMTTHDVTTEGETTDYPTDTTKSVITPEETTESPTTTEVTTEQQTTATTTRPVWYYPSSTTTTPSTNTRYARPTTMTPWYYTRTTTESSTTSRRYIWFPSRTTSRHYTRTTTLPTSRTYYIRPTTTRSGYPSGRTTTYRMPTTRRNLISIPWWLSRHTPAVTNTQCISQCIKKREDYIMKSCKRCASEKCQDPLTESCICASRTSCSDCASFTVNVVCLHCKNSCREPGRLFRFFRRG